MSEITGRGTGSPSPAGTSPPPAAVDQGTQASPKLEESRAQIEAAIEQRLRQRSRRNRRIYLLIRIVSLIIVLAAWQYYGSKSTVRRVTIPPEDGSGPGRGPHRHDGCPEIILIVSGAGEFTTPSRNWPVGPGDVIVVAPGEPHQTRNTGSGDLVSVCFFPVPDLAAVTSEQGGEPVGEPASKQGGAWR